MKEKRPENKVRSKRFQYHLTWISLGVILTGGIYLLAGSWNSFFGPPRAFFMVMVWVLMSASTIFLFLLAVKKAHRLLVDEERIAAAGRKGPGREKAREKKRTEEKEEFDFTAIARKLVRRIPDESSLEETGKLLLKNLAREIEIMSGIFYIRKQEMFEPAGTYALVSPSEPYSFREGEGLTGQVARNQQVMVLTQLPAESLEAGSGLGSAKPSYLAIAPLVVRNRTVAVVECCGFRHDPHEIESMLRIFTRDVTAKLSDYSPEENR